MNSKSVIFYLFVCLLAQLTYASVLHEPTIHHGPANVFSPRVATQHQQTSRSSIVMPPNNHNQALGSFNSHHQHHPRAHQQPANQAEQASSPSSGFLSGGNLELALRQSAGDESVFQPSPAIGAPGHELDWFTQHPPSSPANGGLQVSSASQRLSVLEVMEPNNHQEAAAPAQPATTSSSGPVNTASTWTAVSSQQTTEQSNNIIGQDEPDGRYKHDYHHLGGHQKEYQTNMNSQELNNQVVYEGPATASPTIGDYFFSSSEKLPNLNERPSNAWW